MGEIMVEKKWNEVSKDELEHRQNLQYLWKIKPTRAAVRELERRIRKCLLMMGVDTDKDEESVRFQQEILNINIVPMSTEMVGPKAAGFYFIQNLEPKFAILEAKVRGNRYDFPIIDFAKSTMTENEKKVGE
jgi:hypothetical protein